jgi:hypothetical protein
VVRDACDPTGLSPRKDASQAAGASTVAFVVGGVALAGGVVVYLTAPHPSKSVGFVVTPTVGGGTATFDSRCSSYMCAPIARAGFHTI